MRFENVLELDSQRKIVSGSPERLNQCIAAGADIRIRTDFIHNEHIDPSSDDHQVVAETSTFPETVLIDGRWSACFMTLRQPIALPDGFGDPNSLSLFLYNQDGQQAMARLVLDQTGRQTTLWDDGTDFPKMHTLSVQDIGTAGISKNFIYDFERFRFFAWNLYEELYAHSEEGAPVRGTVTDLEAAYGSGRPIKLAVSGLSRVLWGETGHDDEIFLQGSSAYDYTADPLMISNSVPFVSVPADIPLVYRERGYRYCWLVARSDGKGTIRSYNPFDGRWITQQARLPIRWFAARD